MRVFSLRISRRLFQDLFQNIRTGKEPGLYPAIAYDSFMLIAEAIKQAKTPEERSMVMEALAGMKDMEGVTGKTSMDKDGEAIKRPYILRAVKKGGAVKFELVEG